MMRVTRTFGSATSAAASAPAAGADSKKKEPVDVAKWQDLPLHSWMQQRRSSSVAALSIFQQHRQPAFFGSRCGPHAGLFFPPAGVGCSSGASFSSSLNRDFGNFFSAANNPHGFVAIPYGGSVGEIEQKLRAAVAKKRALAASLRGDCSSHDGIVQQTQREIDLVVVSPQQEEQKAMEKQQEQEQQSQTVIDDFFTEYCYNLVSVMDRLGITWSSVAVSQSFGSMVAAKMALLYPERVGTLFLLPPDGGGASASSAHLITSDAVTFSSQLRECRKAATDINVPLPLLEFSLSELEAAPLQLSDAISATAEDANLIKAALGEKKRKKRKMSNDSSSSSGNKPQQQTSEETDPQFLAVADINAWMTVDQLSLLQHPMCMIASPATNGQVSAHESFFNVKRVAKIKKLSMPPAAAALAGDKKDAATGAAAASAAASSDASSPPSSAETKSVLHPECVAEAAEHLAVWIGRYDSDEMVRRRWAQAKADMEKLLGSDGSGGAGAGAAGAASGGGKEGGKKGKGKGKKPDSNPAADPAVKKPEAAEAKQPKPAEAKE